MNNTAHQAVFELRVRELVPHLQAKRLIYNWDVITWSQDIPEQNLLNSSSKNC